MSQFPAEPTSTQDAIDDAFTNFMVQEGFYIKEGTWYRTNADYAFSYNSLIEKWQKQKKEQFWTTTNTPSQWTTSSKTKKSSSR